MYDENNLLFKDTEDARYRLRYIEGKTGNQRKGEKIKQLEGFIRDSSGRILSYYSISGKCGCISKSVLVNERLSRKSLYSLTSELLPNIIPLSKVDSFVFRKFLEYPGINNYCASKMLETAKGFLLSEKE